MDVSKILKGTIFFVREEEENKNKMNSLIIEDVMTLSKRAENCLKRMGVVTIQELISHTIEDLYNTKNAGKKTVDEIVTKIHELGLTFKDEDLYRI